jgi:hypothetical protein
VSAFVNGYGLFLLKAGFHDAKEGPFRCAAGAQLGGLLESHPQLRGRQDVGDFPRPRNGLVALLGRRIRFVRCWPHAGAFSALTTPSS